MHPSPVDVTLLNRIDCQPVQLSVSVEPWPEDTDAAADAPAVDAHAPQPAAGGDAASASGEERRVDPTDDKLYSLYEFVEVYGGSAEEPPKEWLLAEQRVDVADGQLYSLLDFIEAYSGTAEAPPEEWIDCLCFPSAPAPARAPAPPPARMIPQPASATDERRARDSE